jgi:transmembrane sensor
MTNRQILEEAGAWFVDFRLGEVDGRARREFMGWLRRSPEHIRAYMDISGAYARLPASSVGHEVEIAGMIERTRARATVASLNGAAELAVVPGQAERRRFVRRPVLLAASLAILCSAVMLGYWLVLQRVPVYQTQASEQRAIILDDGSRIDLNVRSRVRVIFDDKQRSVELLEGQGQFQVAADGRRPFVVISGSTRVRALGTRFDVYRKTDGVTVSVLEGRVAVDRASGRGESPPMELGAGEQIIVSAARMAKPPRPSVATATAWVQGELEFDETRLADVAEEFNRYSPRRLVVESPELAEFRVTGVYASADAASLIRFLRNQQDFVVRETGTEIRISRR